ncbi:MAG: Periplasmic zinc-binding protein TroA precursor [Verrucomicrobiota bacterium]
MCTVRRAAFWGMLLVCALGILPEGLAEDRPRKLRVSTFSTVLTEVAQRVGGDHAEVSGHVPIGVDPHEFEPKPAVLKVVASADVVLLSAKHLEGYVGKLRQVAAPGARFVEVGSRIPSLWAAGSEGHRSKVEDPHWWHSVSNMQKAVRVVMEEFVSIQPENRAAFESNAAAYGRELEELQRWAKLKVSELPKDRRRLVTSHEAFGYFAKEYGFTVYAVEGLSASEQPSSKKVAELLGVIREQRVKAVFAQDAANPKVLKQVTSETGAVLGAPLWADGLGPGEASTYRGMFRSNVTAIVEGLK